MVPFRCEALRVQFYFHAYAHTSTGLTFILWMLGSMQAPPSVAYSLFSLAYIDVFLFVYLCILINITLRKVDSHKAQGLVLFSFSALVNKPNFASNRRNQHRVRRRTRPDSRLDGP